ncbi:MAG TPA: cell wall metabolism sensor histidine kinase WalK [Thermoanaerobacterales bacterium]|jgi:two-component system sensor histidine kinase VicK|nr:cell wall metabolism sensor histidine kinase WalK [Thermoanaerobacterales bacterium]
MRNLITKKGSFSLTFRISLVITLLIILLMAAVGSSIYMRDAKTYYDSVKNHGWTMLNTVRAFASRQMQTGDYKSLNKILKSITEDTFIRQATIVNAKSLVIAHVGPQVVGQVIDTGPISDGEKIEKPTMQLLEGNDEGSGFAFIAPIEDEWGQKIGYLYMVQDLGPMEQHLRQLGYDLLKYFLLAIFAGLIVTRLIIIRAVGKPIKEIIGVTEKIALGDFTGRLKIRTADEIGNLAYAFNIMSDRIGILFELIRSGVSEMANASNIIDQCSVKAGLDQGINSDKSSNINIDLKEINTNARQISRNVDKLLSLTKQFNTDINAKGEEL